MTTIPVLLRRLGGQRVVAGRLGLARSAVGNWAVRGSIPGDHVLAIWQMAIEAGIEWEPPGADGLLEALKARLAGDTPSEPAASAPEAA